jgi:diaminohydroxyphosphoribosylaminopyrimidine deaminase/5-amino-6-(5-phosphoribosylamino)uracil reductase
MTPDGKMPESDTRSDRTDGPRRGPGSASPREWEGTGDAYDTDDYFIDRAIDLAWMGAGRTAPNPLVGAVVVKEGRVLGVGYHARYGEDHAETIALDRAGRAAEEATLYVTLEPCAHHGNTPPCVDHVIRSGVSRVVACTRDPDGRVNGRGFKMLRERGIEVDVGRRAERAMLLNMAYFKAKLGLETAVSLKIAVTLDGKTASGSGRRDDITGGDSRRMAHRFRANHDAVLVGIDTVLTDSPRLDCRLLDDVRSPVPVVLDSRLRMPADHHWMAGRRPLIVASLEASRDRETALTRAGARVVRCAAGDGGVDVREAVAALRREGVASLLVEGGGRVFSSFLGAGVWDAMFVFVSPALFGPEAVGLADRVIRKERLGAVAAGVSIHAGDVLLGFVNAETRQALKDHLL